VNCNKLSNVLTDYLDEHKVHQAKEIVPPSLAKEYSCATNFNRETIESVLNFAHQSKQQLIKSQSAAFLNREDKLKEE